MGSPSDEGPQVAGRVPPKECPAEPVERPRRVLKLRLGAGVLPKPRDVL